MMDERVDNRRCGLAKQDQFPCQAFDADRWFLKPGTHEAAETERLCLECPLAQQVRCAQLAVTEGHEHGTWAGVTLPGNHARKRGQLAQARAQLRRIAGIEHCSGCQRWFRVINHTDHTVAAARTAMPAPTTSGNNTDVVCPRCLADQSYPAQQHDETDADQAQITPVAQRADSDTETGNTELDLYWELRRHHRRDPSPHISRTEWLLITPGGDIEGRYAWHTAARSFGRTDQRLQAMLDQGWTIQRATTSRPSHRRQPDPTSAQLDLFAIPA